MVHIRGTRAGGEMAPHGYFGGLGELTFVSLTLGGWTTGRNGALKIIMSKRLHAKSSFRALRQKGC